MGVDFIILDLDIVDVNAVDPIICRTYYVCRLDLNLYNILCAPMIKHVVDHLLS